MMIQTVVIGVGLIVVTCAQGQLCGVTDPKALAVTVELQQISQNSDGVTTFKGHGSTSKDQVRVDYNVFEFTQGKAKLFEIDATFVTPTATSGPYVIKGRDLRTMGDMTVQGPAVFDGDTVRYSALTIGGE
jgi:hypothetical protein